VPSYQERFNSLRGKTLKKSFLERILYASAVLTILGLILFKSTGPFSFGKLMSSALSKSNQGIIINFFEMPNDRIIEILGEPQNIAPSEKGDQLLHWNFDPVTLEICLTEGRVSRITYTTSKKIVRDHIEERALKVYGDEDQWIERVRSIGGEPKVVYENHHNNKTVVKYEDSVMVFDKRFPEFQEID
jgi:hypothetical protein